MNSRQRLPGKSRTAHAFGKAAASYDRFAELQRETADRLLALFEGQVPASILDLGSGTGYCAGQLANRFPHAQICQLDIAPPMLAFARDRHQHGNHRYICGDAEQLPFMPASFDLVVSSLTLQWCEHPWRVFKETAQLLRPGGHVLISTLGEQTLQELRSCWLQVDDQVHVNAFSSVDLLAGAARDVQLKVASRENRQVTRYYDSLAALGRELKGIGAQNRNAGQPAGLTGKHKLARVQSLFQENCVPGCGIPVTWDLVFLHLVK